MAQEGAQSTIPRQKKSVVLCFDGTGNKFSGTEADSNVLKLYRMLDRANPHMYTFYQPGIGTYITSHTMQTTTTAGKIKSWYTKVKDSAIGSNFAEHVMGGYEFLMRYYSCENDLYFFGFSRGAYTARFLAEMLDHIGLLSAGNEELMRFAWKTYAKWAARENDGSTAAQGEEEKLYQFMRGFRETFSRPIRRLCFLGLFDTVNSVPKFEPAWMQRSKFPYTARSSAKMIRHAVSVDERRAKFRQDLVSGDQPQREDRTSPALHRYNSDFGNTTIVTGPDAHKQDLERPDGVFSPAEGSGPTNEKAGNAQGKQNVSWLGMSKGLSKAKADGVGNAGLMSTEHLHDQGDKAGPRRMKRRQYSESRKKQDIEEVWFAGGHADIGGGRGPVKGEKWMLSHAPLVWMIHEAAQAGLPFDHAKVARHRCHPDRVDEYGEPRVCEQTKTKFLEAFQESFSHGIIHDALKKTPGLPASTLHMWKAMEYLPFRRMDLQPDGSWKVIRWPPPMGETRDIPKHAQIHHSAIKRMQVNPDYRPGNLIVGGGGRGVRKAPSKYGMGDWEKCKNPDDPVAETYCRADLQAVAE